ncbi:hypothetical protein H2204_001944 [Knufia peltigerae]|uniref:F-box domain-containing protein n=1 Tax=Knufia peltigerae TaxID=1002370 RepID=A0AA38YC94_9EURO|nr:hypothetical protein H2204_001944 [Knufia peltigerae]
MSTSNQSRPRRAARVRYNEDSDSVDLSDFETRPQPQRAVRRRIQTYREQSSDEDTTETSSDESDSLSEEVLPQQGTRSRPKRIHKPSTRPQKRKPQKAGTRTVANPFSAYKRQKTRSHDVNHSKAKDAITISLPPNGRIPPWQQLPYQILVSIMRYAAYPLYESRSRPTASIHWLCSLSRLCRSFHDACTAALLHNPPLYPDVRAYGLIHLLQQDPGRLMTNYRRKIHYLDIEVKHLLARKSGIALADLISNTPLLQGMRLYSTYDDWRTEVWAQPGVRKIHWSYPPELFDLLDDNNVILKQFEWNGRFPSPTEVLETTLAAHSRPAFSRLQELSLLNLTPPDKSSDAEIAKFQSMFTSAFEHLTGLKRLSLINCGCLDESTTPMLPVGLEYLEIDNCSKLTSTALERYLQVGGSTIRTLKLCDNQSMSLGFMADVKSMCPRLQDIDVDMLYVDPTSYRDRDPLYDELLPNGPPTWPSSLVNVSFENMRQLSAEDAEDFFDSLVESSRHLPRLKRLNIKAILKNASWRDRAQLRKMWLPKLQNVFLNRSKPSGPAPVSAAGGHTKRASVSQRQSSRIAESLKRMSTGDDTGDSDAASSSLAIQGRCDVVNLQISDQRPAQDQFREDDFLDDEPSDDEEWMGVDREPVSTGYAW